MALVLIVIALIYCCLPWYIAAIVWVINLFFPDGIPIIDELLMFVPIVSKIKRAALIADIIEKYGKLLLGAAIVLAILFIIVLVL